MMQTQAGNFLAAKVQKREWLGVKARSFEQKVGPGRAWHKLSSPTAILSVVLKQVGGHCETRTNLNQSLVDSDRIFAEEGHISVVPPGCDVWGYTEGVSIVQEARFFIDMPTAYEIVGEDFSENVLYTPWLMKADREISTLARLLFVESWRQSNETLYAEGLTAALVARLSVLDDRFRHKARASGLTPKQLRAVTDFVGDNMAEKISLQDLAKLVGLSRSQFGRAFKVSTGMSPHRYHLEQRLNSAKHMLSGTRESLVEIALATGFSEQSHFNRVFRSSVGTTPAAWRRSL